MKERYTKIIIKILICIPSLFSIFIIDLLILPQKIINDKIIAYSQIIVNNQHKYSSGSTKLLMGNTFYTEKGLDFSVREIFIKEEEVTIIQSYLFQHINSVKSKNKDYSDKLMSGLNSAGFYITLILVLTAVISIYILKFEKNLSENGFQNIILINSLLAIFALYAYIKGL